MIHTFYSNAYEGLEATLIQNVLADLKVDPNDLSSAFKKAVIVRPSSYIEDKLARSLADKTSVASCVEFLSLFGWLQPKVGATFRSGSVGSAIDWQIWEALNDQAFLDSVKQMQPKPDKFLNFVEKNKGRDELVGLSRHLGKIFSNYTSYRIDWVLNWLGDTSYKISADKQEILNNHPDYQWQKALWKYMYDKALSQCEKFPNHSQDLLNLKSISKRIEDIEFTAEDSRQPIHLFMPFAFPPLLLPFIRAYSEKPNAPDLWIYVLNPCKEYWFESVPLSVFDWSTTPTEDSTNRFLINNNASTRAMIDRLYRFLNTDNKDHFETQENLEEKLPPPKAPPRKRVLKDLDEFDPNQTICSEKSDLMSCFFEQTNTSYLKRFRNSILHHNPKLLPSEPINENMPSIPDAHSLLVFKAPSFTREIESLIDWFHHRFRADENLTPSDILVMVPDINEATPQIEAVMASLPDSMALPWRILGNSLVDSNLTVNSILAFGKLLGSKFEREDFLNWLELPVVQERWGLTLSDVAVLGQWLRSAGFRHGLTKDILEKTGETIDDTICTLEDAFERLTLGYFINSSEQRTFGDLLPTFGTEAGGFDEVKDDRARLLKIFAALLAQLTTITEDLYNHDNLAMTANQWYDTVSGWIDTFFTTKHSNPELSDFRTTLSRAIAGMRDGLTGNKAVSFQVFWSFLSAQLQDTPNPAKSIGAITFSSLETCRGVPFKIIVLAGFSEKSGFPGRSFNYDFDLMGVPELKRRSDRDSREDNKARFFDAMMSARDCLVLSYSIGTTAGEEDSPCSVIQSFKNYFLSNANKENAAKIWKSLEVKIPLNYFSKRNFIRNNPYQSNDARYWLSPRKETIEPLKEALTNRYSSPLPPFADCMDTTFKSNQLPAQVLINFFASPDSFLLKRYRLNEFLQNPSNPFNWILDTDDHLLLKTLKKKWWDQFDSGYPLDEISNQNQYNPLLGMSKQIRNAISCEQLDGLHKVWLDFDSYRRDCDIHKDKDPLRVELTLTNTSFFTEIVDLVTENYQDGNNCLVLFEPALSKTDLFRSKLRALIWIAAGQSVDLLYPVNLKKKSIDRIEFIVSQPMASSIVEQLVSIFEKSLCLSIGYTIGDNEEDTTTLYRGLDAGFISQLQNASKNLKNLIAKKSLDGEKISLACQDLRDVIDQYLISMEQCHD